MSRSLHPPLTPSVRPITLLFVCPNQHHQNPHPHTLLIHCCHSSFCVPLCFILIFVTAPTCDDVSAVDSFACVCVFVFSALCVDSETSAVRSFGDTWLRWRGQRVEYCHCAWRGQERCHSVPVISECNMSADTHKHTLSSLLSSDSRSFNLSLSYSWCVFTDPSVLPCSVTLSSTRCYSHRYFFPAGPSCSCVQTPCYSSVSK